MLRSFWWHILLNLPTILLYTILTSPHPNETRTKRKNLKANKKYIYIVQGRKTSHNLAWVRFPALATGFTSSSDWLRLVNVYPRIIIVVVNIFPRLPPATKFSRAYNWLMLLVTSFPPYITGYVFLTLPRFSPAFYRLNDWLVIALV